MRKVNLCIIVAGCLLLATVTAPAGQRSDTNSDVIVSQPSNLPNPLNALYEKMLDELNLTADQQSRIKQILETHHQAMTNWRKQHAAELKSLREEIIEAVRFQFLLGCFAVLSSRIARVNVFFQFLLGCFRVGVLRETLNNYQRRRS
mgnify:CR=1 FL=1